MDQNRRQRRRGDAANPRRRAERRRPGSGEPLGHFNREARQGGVVESGRQAHRLVRTQPADLGLLAGDIGCVAMVLDGLFQDMRVDAGQLRLLNLWTPVRSKNWPDTPTLKELGYPFVFDSPFGLAGPKGMDPAHVSKLHDAFKLALEDQAVIDTLRKYDMFPRYMNTADYIKSVGEVVAQEKSALELIGLLKKE